MAVFPEREVGAMQGCAIPLVSDSRRAFLVPRRPVQTMDHGSARCAGYRKLRA